MVLFCDGFVSVMVFRQLMVMDETHVMNQMKEDVCYVSCQFNKDMETARFVSKAFSSFVFTTSSEAKVTDQRLLVTWSPKTHWSWALMGGHWNMETARPETKAFSIIGVTCLHQASTHKQEAAPQDVTCTLDSSNVFWTNPPSKKLNISGAQPAGIAQWGKPMGSLSLNLAARGVISHEIHI